MPSAVRASDEEHRTATALELFFDLCFVVAVAQAAERRALPLTGAVVALSLVLGLVASVPVAMLGTAAAFAALVTVKVVVVGVARPVQVV